MIAVSRVAVNHDGKGGFAPDPLVWDHGGRRKVRRTDIRVKVDLASLPGPRAFLNGPGCRFTGVASLVLMLLSGRVVLASHASLLPFLVLCICLSVLLTKGILGSLFWRFLSFSSNGLVIDCSVKKGYQTTCSGQTFYVDSLCACVRGE